MRIDELFNRFRHDVPNDLVPNLDVGPVYAMPQAKLGPEIDGGIQVSRSYCLLQSIDDTSRVPHVTRTSDTHRNAEQIGHLPACEIFLKPTVTHLPAGRNPFRKIRLISLHIPSSYILSGL